MNFGVSFQPNGFLLHIWLVGNGCSYCMPVICCMSGFLPRVAPPSSANITGPGPKLHELLVSALDAHHTSSLPVFLALWPFVAHLTCGARLLLPYARLDMPVQRLTPHHSAHQPAHQCAITLPSTATLYKRTEDLLLPRKSSATKTESKRQKLNVTLCSRNSKHSKPTSRHHLINTHIYQDHSSSTAL